MFTTYVNFIIALMALNEKQITTNDRIFSCIKMYISTRLLLSNKVCGCNSLHEKKKQPQPYKQRTYEKNTLNQKKINESSYTCYLITSHSLLYEHEGLLVSFLKYLTKCHDNQEILTYNSRISYFSYSKVITRPNLKMSPSPY